MSDSSPPLLTLYGIPSCDTLKKARAWLEAHHVPYRFHDYKRAGIDRERLEQWCQALGWTALLNRAGTTFRRLDASLTADLDQTRAIALMQAYPSLIKRPLLEHGSRYLVGFKPDQYAAALLSPEASS